MRDINKVHVAHTINGVSLSIISIYIPVYLLTLGYKLPQVLLFFAIAPVAGVLISLFLYVRLIQKIGPINTFKIYYPLQVIYLVSLFLLKDKMYSMEIVAILYGAANYAYWIPINLLFIKHSEENEMGKNLSKFFALPQLFGIIGPLISALLVPFWGFWPVFAVAILGVMVSYLPLRTINDEQININLNLRSSIDWLAKHKSLFLFELLDNIVEESEWFWPIYVYLFIGSLSSPGIVGSLESIGAAAFTFLVGKYTNNNAKKLIPVVSILFITIFALRIFITQQFQAYIITIAASFVMTLYLVTYFSTVFKTVKGKDEEEFIILREIPTALGRLVVFGGIYLFATNLRYFFIVPIIFIFILMIVFWWRRKLLVG